MEQNNRETTEEENEEVITGLGCIFNLPRASLHASVHHPQNRRRPFGKRELMARCMADLARYEDAPMSAGGSTASGGASSSPATGGASLTTAQGGASPPTAVGRDVPGRDHRSSPVGPGGPGVLGRGRGSSPSGDVLGRDHGSSPAWPDRPAVIGRGRGPSPGSSERRDASGRDHRSSPAYSGRPEERGRDRRSSPVSSGGREVGLSEDDLRLSLSKRRGVVLSGRDRRSSRGCSESRGTSVSGHERKHSLTSSQRRRYEVTARDPRSWPATTDKQKQLEAAKKRIAEGKRRLRESQDRHDRYERRLAELDSDTASADPPQQMGPPRSRPDVRPKESRPDVRP